MKNVDKRKLMKSELKCLFIDAEVPSSKQVINYLVHCQNLNIIYNIILLISMLTVVHVIL